MKQSQELGDFKESTEQKYEEVFSDGEKQNLYIHKTGFPNVMVRAPRAYKKTHCWRLKTLEVTQYATINGAREKAVAEIEFDGQLIFTLIPLFNQMMGRQILEYVENITVELRNWCEAPIKNVFLLKERTEESLGFKHGFIKITPQLFYIDKSYYFEYRCWGGEVESQVPEIEFAEQVQGTSSYTGMFEFICNKIQRHKMLKKLATEKKKMKVLKQKEQQWKKEKQKNIEYVEYEESNQYSNRCYNQNSKSRQFDE